MHRRDAGLLLRQREDLRVGVERDRLADAHAQRAEFPTLEVQRVVGDFEQHLAELPRHPRRLLAFLGSTIGNLDPTTSVGIMKLLDQINRDGTTVLMATHDATIVDQMRRRVIELSRGELVRDQAQGVYGYQ